MRWKKPKINDTRIIERFLIFPCCINGDVRWLERAVIEQFYKRTGMIHCEWINIRFVDLKEMKDE